MNNNKIVAIISILVVYLLSTGVSYALFSRSSSAVYTTALPSDLTAKKGDSQAQFDSTLPKTEACPTNGVLYSKQQREWWEAHRPLGVMIENHEDARPQSGLSFADVIYEAVAEGGITRFLAVFYCRDGGQIGPVRSARTYFVDFISEYGDHPLYTHVGGANTPGPADALSQLTDYGWTGNNDLNQFSIGFPTFWRDYDRLGHTVATEHTMYSTTSKLWDFAKKSRDLTNVDKKGKSWDESFVPYSFVDAEGKGLTQKIHVEFWNGYKQYFVDWDYDSKTNVYKRSNAGVAHLDKDTNKQLTTKNLAVLVMQEQNANDGYENNLHLLYKNKGTGKAIVFKDGKKIPAMWKKDSRTSRTLLFDENGAALKFNRGTIWFEVLPTDGIIKVE